MDSAWQRNPSRRATANAVAESRPPLSKITARGVSTPMQCLHSPCVTDFIISHGLADDYCCRIRKRQFRPRPVSGLGVQPHAPPIAMLFDPRIDVAARF